MLTRETRTRDIVIKTVKQHICTSRKFMAAFEDFFFYCYKQEKKNIESTYEEYSFKT